MSWPRCSAGIEVSEDALAAAMATLWDKNRDTVVARAVAVHRALLDGVGLDEAAREAHVLAGALGTYGRPGSALFAEVERVLDGDEAEADLPALAARVSRAISQL
jgi:hypothetical protein